MNRRQWVSLVMLLLGVGLWTGWRVPDPAGAETVIKIGGTGSALGAMKQLVEAFAQDHPDVKVQILPSLGSSAGIKAVLNGGLALALTSRPLTESERRQGAVEVEYARSPLVFVTNGMVDQKDLTTPELEAIYSGRMSKWSDGSRIRLILRPEKDIDTQLVRGISPGLKQAVKALLARPGMIVPITDQESSAAVANTPGALGWATLSDIRCNNWPVHVLTFNGVQPSVKAIAEGSYPLAKSLYLVTTPKTPTAARQFADFVMSPAGRTILMKTDNLVPES